MKNKTKITFAMFLTLSMIIQSTAALAGENGSNVGNGGDSDAAAFVGATANSLLGIHFLCNVAKEKIQICDYLDPIRLALASTKVTPSTEPIFGPDQKPREAINDGMSKITINKVAIETLLESDEGKIRLAQVSLHEFATNAKLEGSDEYHASNTIMTTLLAYGIKVENLVSGNIIPDGGLNPKLEIILKSENLHVRLLPYLSSAISGTAITAGLIALMVTNPAGIIVVGIATSAIGSAALWTGGTDNSIGKMYGYKKSQFTPTDLALLELQIKKECSEYMQKEIGVTPNEDGIAILGNHKLICGRTLIHKNPKRRVHTYGFNIYDIETNVHP